MKRLTFIILTSACIFAYASGIVAQRPADGRLSPRLLNYQGYLTDTLGNPITNPSVSMTFSIYDAVSAGSLKWTETQGTVGVDKGIFNVLLGGVTQIPDSVFKTGANRWLELIVGGQTLSPRTRIVSVPYAYSATYSDTALYAVNSAPDFDWIYRITDTADTTLQMGGRWGLTRPGNTLYGNRDSTHVNLGFASTTGTNGQNYVYSTVGGGYLNNAGGQCATVAGGSVNVATGECATVAGGNVNTAGNYNATVSGGQGNIASGYIATVGGGKENRARGAYSVVSGGGGQDYADSNSAIGDYSAVGGGRTNTASGYAATVGGGANDRATGNYSMVAGGAGNIASGSYSTVSGGIYNTASGHLSATGGGQNNTAADSFNCIGGGYLNRTAGKYTAILGGYADTITATGSYSYLFGINSNLTQDSTFMVDMPHVWFGTEANGYEFPYGRGTDGQVMKTNGSGILSWGSIAYVDSARVAANAHKLQGKDTVNFNIDYVNEGQVNSIANAMIQDGAVTTPKIADTAVTMPKISQAGAVAGQVIKWNGTTWQPAADSSMDNDWSYLVSDGADTTLLMGGRWGLARPGNVLFGNADSTHVNLGVVCTTGTSGGNFKYSTVAGGYYNSASNRATVAGGQFNGARGEYSTVGGGSYNIAGGWTATIAGGDHNTASNNYAFVGGGQSNTASGNQAFVGGGNNNNASGQQATIGGGWNNNAWGDRATVGGGYANTATYYYSTVGGGNSNAASFYSTVGGGAYNNAGGERATVGGGWSNNASSIYATVSGGSTNTAGGYSAAVGGGQNNTAADSFNCIGGGYLNRTAGKYTAILGGYADTITATGSYSYLFGINSNLTQDSTFMVDMPHVWLGTEANGYEFPYGRGTDGQVMKTNGSGILSWGSIVYVDSARVAANAHKLQGKDTTDLNNSYVNEGQVNSIANAMIQDGAVTTTKIADTAVTMPKISQAGATTGQVIKWNGTAWQPAADSSKDSDWNFLISDGADTTLQMGGRWGIARAGNTFFGNGDSTHVNFGVSCTTGTNGNNFKYTTITGGMGNSARNDYTTVSGGYQNIASNNYATVGGGIQNIASGWVATVGGGVSNQASNEYATVSGGSVNIASGIYAIVGGGRANKARGQYSVVSGGGSTVEADSNSAIGDYSVISGGCHNISGSIYATVGGGYLNNAGGDRATVNGGSNNTASGLRSTIGGGWYNTTSNFEATVGGGTNNNGSGNQSTIAGGGYNISGGTCSAIGGGYGNSSAGNGGVIAGGESNNEVGSFQAIGGGKYNDINGDYSNIGGGESNQVLGYYSAILGGYADTIFADGDYSYLFGINSNLTRDSTFMVDLPHIRFGTEAAGYEFPTTDGTNGQALVTNGTGQASWGTPSKHVTYTPGSSSDPNGNVGDMAWDDSYVYVKTSAGWKRSALSTW